MVQDLRVTQQLSRLGGLYRDPVRVGRDASYLLKSSVGNHLIPITAQMFENDGTSQTVLVLQGTIAMHFRGNTYQILIDMYLPAKYPSRPPVVYVRLPDSTMYLKENHPHVASDGKVYLPYLHEWTSTTHNLVELVVAMSSVFSAEPPVFTRAPAPPPPPPPAAAAAHTVSATATAGYYNPSTSISTSTGTGTTTTTATVSQMPSAVHKPPPPYPGPGMVVNASDQQAQIAAYLDFEKQAEERRKREEQERLQRLEEERRLAREKEEQQQREKEQRALAQKQWEERKKAQVRSEVALKLQKYLQEEAQQTKQLLQSDARDQQRLQIAADQKINVQLKYLKELQEKLQGHLKTVQTKTVAIEDWLQTVRRSEQENKQQQQQQNEQQNQNESDAVRGVPGIQAAHPWHEQMIQLAAENAALSDCLYFIDKALYQNHIDINEHLKQVRQLSKRQFLVRAHLIKMNQMLWTNTNKNTNSSSSSTNKNNSSAYAR